MNERDESPDNFDEGLEGGDEGEQPYDPCNRSERPSINNGGGTPPDQDQHEIPSSNERSSLSETGNAGERPSLSSSPESTGTSTQQWTEKLGIGGERAGDRSAAREAQERGHFVPGHAKVSELEKQHRKMGELEVVG